MSLAIPPGLAESCRGDPARTAWLQRLPGLVADLARRWALRVGPPFPGAEGSCAWVAPVTHRGGGEGVLKVALPHLEGAHEIDGLRYWGGRRTVRLLDADDARCAMLLERCVPGTPLRALPEPEQDAVLAELLPRLWQKGRERPVGSSSGLAFRPLAEMLRHWAEETRAAVDDCPDPGLVQAGLDLFEELPMTAPEDVVLFTDLHAGNVLRARRAPWLAIDPKPFVGDPAYDATQHLFNCPGRMRTAAAATLTAFAERLGVSPARVRLWMFARAAAEPRRDWDGSPWLDVARQLAP